MQQGKGKYYDWSRQQVLDPQNDGCDYAEWPDKFDSCPFAVHPKGFLVFLAPDELEASDEYKEADPYTVEADLEGEWQQRRVQTTLELITPIIHGKGGNVRILDLGCGQGQITSKIHNTFPMAEVSGLDYAISAIIYAIDAFPGIDFIVGTAYDPPYSAEYFDVVICNNIWEHVPDPLFLLDKVRRVLKPGGHLLIATPSRYQIGNVLRVVLGRPVKFQSKMHVTEYSVGQVMEQLKFGKFDVLKVYSRPVKNKNATIKARVLREFIMPIIRLYLKVINSHHSLESTVFYVARKR